MPSPLLQFDRQWGLSSSESESPIFLLSAGWRSGSTLLQRLLCSSQEVVVWGEAYARCGLIQKLADATRALTANYPQANHFMEVGTADLQDKWIANLFPPPADMKAAYRAALDAFLLRPATRAGYSRFGLKEVRLDADHGRFLQWVYPDARFFCLVRNPWEAWQSARGLPLYLDWPDVPVASPEVFATHWLRLVESFAEWREESVYFFRYEDLIGSPNAPRAVAHHAGLSNVDSGVLQQVIGSRQNKPPLPQWEADAITRIAGEAAKQLGYSPSRACKAA
ncbi:MAG: sulfotransferase [Myxococcota bacterium]|nr:sulfotransferase [Myxococcota bacterium]